MANDQETTWHDWIHKTGLPGGEKPAREEGQAPSKKIGGHMADTAIIGPLQKDGGIIIDGKVKFPFGSVRLAADKKIDEYLWDQMQADAADGYLVMAGTATEPAISLTEKGRKFYFKEAALETKKSLPHAKLLQVLEARRRASESDKPNPKKIILEKLGDAAQAVEKVGYKWRVEVAESGKKGTHTLSLVSQRNIKRQKGALVEEARFPINVNQAALFQRDIQKVKTYLAERLGL